MRTSVRGGGLKRGLRGPVIVVAAVLPWLSGGRAEAQWGWGWGMGWGGGGAYNRAMLNEINQQSLQAGAAAYADRRISPYQRNNAYAGNPNSYINHVRDDSFFDRYDAATRRSIEYRVARNPERDLIGEPAVRPTPAPRAAPARALASFFNAAGALIWPSEAPTAGDLATLRDDAARSAAVVFTQVRSQGQAPVALVNAARSALLAYGRPALVYLDKNASPGVSDSFDRFLLALYDALATAAHSPSPAPAGGPPPIP